MALALKEQTQQTKPTAAEWQDKDDDETEAWYEEMPDFPFVYDYDRQGYAISDGQPLAETNKHRKEINTTLDELEAHFASHADVYVAGCDFMYYERGNRNARLSPDAYVVFGVPKDVERENYKIWEEGGIGPALVIEVTSKKTKRTDEVEKFTLYEQTLKVPEYFLFDPRPFLRPRIRLRGFRLNAAGNYEAIARDADGRLYSEQLDLHLEEQGRDLRLFDARTGEYLRTPQESEAQRKIAERRAAEEAQQGKKEKARADSEARRAERETQRAEREAQRAEREAQARRHEKARADDAEAENALLRAQLDALRNANKGKRN